MTPELLRILRMGCCGFCGFCDDYDAVDIVLGLWTLSDYFRVTVDLASGSIEPVGLSAGLTLGR